MVCKMIKKGVVGAALGAGALALVFGTAAPSYFCTAVHNARKAVKGSVPVEFEIERARQEIAKLGPAIEGGIETLARAMGEEQDLGREIASIREDLGTQGKELQALNVHLKTGDLHLTGGVAYSTTAVKADLARRLDHYRLVKTILTEKQETLKHLQQNVVAARDGLTALQNAKSDLTARVEGAEARLNQIKASRASNRFSFDDSAVGQAKKTVAELEKRLEQMARVDELKTRYAEGGVSVTVEPDRDVAREIDAEFSSSPKTDEKAVEKF